ncbi:MAG: DUF4925 domain-containing protein [Tannerellaceae bacterium]|jgi:hypothetical protein|nr:DUF4925 domain-containing protein [Tannerellaceae bacterium]
MYLVSCDDKDKDVTPAWESAVGTYKADGSLMLTINDLPPVGKEATLAAGTGANAKIALTNIIPDMATVEIDNVVMAQGGTGVFTFEGEAAAGAYTTVNVKGTLSGINEAVKTLNLNVTRKVSSPLTGTLKLAAAASGNGKFVKLNVKTDNAANDAMLNQMVEPMISGMLAQKVSDVTVVLGTDGLFDVNWTETGASASTGMPDFVKQLVSIQYFMEDDNKLYLALDKSALLLLAALPLPEGVNLDALIGALAVDKGGFIAIPVNFEGIATVAAVTRETAPAPDLLFYVGKEMLSPLLPLLMPALTGALPEGFPEYLLPLLQGLPDIVNGAERFDVGLGFAKI